MAAGAMGVGVEVEAKLAAAPGIVLADLTGVMDGVTAVAQPTRYLDAAYYDTVDLRLSRSGITLRYRQGEAGPAWTVKLPTASDGDVLARREVTFDEPPGAVPAGAADLISATTRGRCLDLVARVSTRRVPVELRGRDGAALAEVVDDAVSVARGHDGASQFREVEIEVFDHGRAGRRLLKATVRRLVDSGCVRSIPVPKLVRVLGEQAVGPPDVVVSPLETPASVADLVRHAVARSVAQLVEHDPGVRIGEDPEDVHQLRVATRRLRSDLRTFAPIVSPAPANHLRSDLAWLATHVGPARESDVLASRLARAITALPDADAQGASRLLALLQEQAHATRAVMLEALRDPRYLRLIDDLVQLAMSPPIVDGKASADGGAARVAAHLVRGPWKRVAAAVSELGPDPADSELHRIRILAKRCRYAAEAAAPVLGPVASRFAEALAGVQSLLGDHHDTVVAEAWLRDAAAREPAAALAAGQLIAVQIARRTQLRRQWPATWQNAASKKLRRWRES